MIIDIQLLWEFVVGDCGVLGMDVSGYVGFDVGAYVVLGIDV